MLISEDFYSIQGEGHTTGVPAYFVRLANCNLYCGASRKEMNSIIKEELHVDPNQRWHGELHKTGKASWTCDSIPVWYKGIERDNQYLINRWKEQGIYEDIKSGKIHIIWTGGEPTMPKSQEAIVKFTIDWINSEEQNICHWIDYPNLENHKRDYENPSYKQIPYYEIETNGTFVIDKQLFIMIDQINCSVKLSNSGMEVKQRIKPDALNQIMKHKNYWFKFVIESEEDIKEIFRDFIEPFNIPLTRVMCMPALDDQEKFHERTNFVCEMAKKYKFIAGTRLHISSWGAVTGV